MDRLHIIDGRRKDDKTKKECAEQSEIDTVTYTNRKRRKYYLFQTKTKNGKIRYVFRRNIEGLGEPVPKIPRGHEISESVNGIVSLRKVFKSPIQEEEIAIVRSVLKKHKHLVRYRADDVKGDIVIFEPIGGITSELLQALQSFNPFPAPLTPEILEQSVRYSPVLRFRLADEKNRRFCTERMTYRGEGDWMSLMNGNGTIRNLAERFCGKLGCDSFFDLF